MASPAVITLPTPAPASARTQFLVNRKEFIQELALAQSVREPKTTIPALSCLMLRADMSGHLSIVGTDLDHALFTTCSARVVSGGSLLLPARKLFDYVRLLEGDDVAFTLLDNNWVQIRCGRSKTKMVGLSPANFPAIPEYPEKPAARLPVQLFRSLLERVAFAISTQESRYTLSAALVQLASDSITLVATDGHRLAFAKALECLDTVTAPTEYLLALKGVQHLTALLANTREEFVDFAANDATLFFRAGPRIYSVRKMPGQFPSYQKIMPTNNDRIVILSVKELAETLKRVAQFADDRSSLIRFSLGANQLSISSSSTESGESEEILATPYEREPISLGFNASFLLDALTVMAVAEVRVELRDASSSVQLRPHTDDTTLDYRVLVMPART
jgi:DNA polymerase-3 subunit beta